MIGYIGIVEMLILIRVCVWSWIEAIWDGVLNMQSVVSWGDSDPFQAQIRMLADRMD